MKVETVKELPRTPGGADQVLVKAGELYFVVSSVYATLPPLGFETLVFRANQEGEVVDWTQVAGGKDMDREEAIEDLEQYLDTGYSSSADSMFDDFSTFGRSSDHCSSPQGTRGPRKGEVA